MNTKQYKQSKDIKNSNHIHLQTYTLRQYQSSQYKVVTIDYRNCKYQGYTKNNNINQNNINDKNNDKFGIALDQNYTWIAGQWDNRQLLQSNFAVVFGDSQKMFGEYSKQQIDGYRQIHNKYNRITVYQSNGYRIYKNNEIIVMDINSYCNQFNNTFTKYEYKFKEKVELNMKDHIKYNDKNYIVKLLQLFEVQQNSKQQYLQSCVNIQQYLKCNYPFNKYLQFNKIAIPAYHNTNNSKISNLSKQYDLIITVKNLQQKQQLPSIKIKLLPFLKYKISKIWYDNQNNLTNRKNNKNNKNGQICKKIQYYVDGDGAAIVQQEINDQVEAYVDYQINGQSNNYTNYQHMNNKNKYSNSKYNNTSNMQQFDSNSKQSTDYYGRSNLQIHKHCMRNMQQYYRRSINFSNSFLNLSQIYKHRKIFKQIHRQSMALLQQQNINALKNGVALSEYFNKNEENNTQQKEIRNNNNFNKNNNVFDNGDKQKVKFYQASLQDIRNQLRKTQDIGRSKLTKSNRTGINRTSRINYEQQHADHDMNIGESIFKISKKDNTKYEFANYDNYQVNQNNNYQTEQQIYSHSIKNNSKQRYKQNRNNYLHKDNNLEDIDSYDRNIFNENLHMQTKRRTGRKRSKGSNNGHTYTNKRLQQKYKGYQYQQKSKSFQQEQQQYPYRYKINSSPQFKNESVVNSKIKNNNNSNKNNNYYKSNKTNKSYGIMTYNPHEDQFWQRHQYNNKNRSPIDYYHKYHNATDHQPNNGTYHNSNIGTTDRKQSNRNSLYVNQPGTNSNRSSNNTHSSHNNYKNNSNNYNNKKIHIFSESDEQNQQREFDKNIYQYNNKMIHNYSKQQKDNQPLELLMMHYQDIQQQLQFKSKQKHNNKLNNNKITTPINKLIYNKQKQFITYQNRNRLGSAKQNQQQIISKSKSKSKDQSRSKSKNKSISRNKSDNKIADTRYNYNKGNSNNKTNYIGFNVQQSNKKVSKISAIYNQFQKNKKQQNKYAR